MDNKMNQQDILITGASGQLGSELKILFPRAIHMASSDFDLRDENDIRQMFLENNPKAIIHLAARVGGVKDNIKNPALYFDDNILMNTLLLKHARLNKVDRFIAILSSCIFPNEVEQYPLMEEDMHSGPPASTNFFYAYAKRAMAVQINAYNKQYGTKYNYVIPCNLYGKSNKEYSNKSHFPLALVAKIKRALENGDDHIVLFGDGTPLRQLMHSRDLAQILKIMIDQGIYENFNIAPGENLSIDEIAEQGLIAAGATHLKINYDKSQPNGQHRKDVSNKKMRSIIKDYKFIKLVDGLREVYKTL
tara:strand:+ start:4615 stop:5529 length:915 start_codon:yes stop_codon:yes gene_type:complete